jgi:hypothetical protein
VARGEESGGESGEESGEESGACRWFHTLGMLPGEALFFRNGMVMHGTARLGGEGSRMSLAIDCVASRT